MTEPLKKYLEENRRKVQLRQLEILKAIDRICRLHQIDYWLDGGTLLGAVRHKGFIPWDDDIDIAMPREQLTRFVETARKELPEELLIQTPETEPALRLPICKVRDKNSFLVEPDDDFKSPYNKGLYVDIFPMIDYPSCSKRFYKRVCRGFCRADAILRAKHNYNFRAAAEFFYFEAKRAACLLSWKLACAGKMRGEFISNTLNNNGYGIAHRKDSVFPLSEIGFEGCRFQAPANPDAYLSELYGDYLQLPPEDKRGGHAVFYLERLLN